jgi:hypothetical protein
MPGRKHTPPAPATDLARAELRSGSDEERANSLPEPLGGADLDVDAILKEVAAEELPAQGCRPASSGPGQYLLSYQVRVTTWHGTDTRSVGSLSLWMSEAATNERVWAGFARAEIHVGLRGRSARRACATPCTRCSRSPPRTAG